MIGRICVTAAAISFCTSVSAAETLTIATVNNADMLRMQRMSVDFEEKHPGIKLNWVVLEETELRRQVASDIASHGGKFDILTIGTYEVPIWAQNGWLLSLDDLDAAYDVGDLIPAIRSSLSFKQSLYAAPFYGESSMVMYRKDLMDKAGLAMPEAPTWNFIAKAAAEMNAPSAGVAGICLRGKPGWGENMAILTVSANSFGARWFDEAWQPQFDGPEWKQTVQFYADLMRASGPKSPEKNGFAENLALFQAGKCGLWIDATVAASFISDPKVSKVADKVGFALAPNNGLGKNANWLWAWSLAIPASTAKADSAKQFVEWATDKSYAELVAAKEGWANAPPGTRTSLYRNPLYNAAAPFAAMTLKSIDTADPRHPAVDPVPYVGVQLVAIPEFEAMANAVGRQFSRVLQGDITVEAALANAQTIALREMRKGGYVASTLAKVGGGRH